MSLLSKNFRDSVPNALLLLKMAADILEDASYQKCGECRRAGECSSDGPCLNTKTYAELSAFSHEAATLAKKLDKWVADNREEN